MDRFRWVGLLAAVLLPVAENAIASGVVGEDVVRASVGSKSNSLQERSSGAARLVIAGWPGAYGVAQDEAIIAPFVKYSGREVEVIRQPMPVRSDEARIPAGADVVEMTSGALAAACARGEILALGGMELQEGAGGQQPADDFIESGLSRCGIGSFVWSALFAVDPRAFEGDGPRSLRDVFNSRRYRGKRAIIREPRRLMEMALMADGVPARKVYEVLATRAGMQRALRRVGAIRKDIVWVDGPVEALALLARGEVAMAMAYSGRAFRSAVSQNYRLIWDGSVRDVTYWAVPLSAANIEGASSFIRFATAPDRLAEQAMLWPYGPARFSAVELVGTHRHLPVELRSFLPSAPEHLEVGLTTHGPFWAEHGASITAVFSEWLDGRSPSATGATKTRAAKSRVKTKRSARATANGSRSGNKRKGRAKRR